MAKKKILVAPLNWGLGHATRCIPIIHALQQDGFEPILASDGDALLLLKKEFPNLSSYQLPSYKIKYAKKSYLFKLKFLFRSPHIIQAVRKEYKATQQIHEKENLDGIISDNRLGVRIPGIKSVYITHQLHVLSGITTKLTTWAHHHFIKKFDACWVPDVEFSPSLSGKLSHFRSKKFKVNYIGPLSRFSKKKLPIKYDLMCILSGPEPQRGLLENKLREEIRGSEKNILFICGKMERNSIKSQEGNTVFYNFLTGKELETAFNQSEIIIARSGYTTLMDLAKLEKKAFFIPTPGQQEQEYLAKRLKRKKIAPSCKQNEFNLALLKDINTYSGFTLTYTNSLPLQVFFQLF
ncbi:glycosyltransferase [Mesonia ostreae]|uniref:Glycosyltransferase n=1 Tax=Mesonia ostreae TaxID=861110 RepID=A0ABU2KHC9_9FLAO|nr:glycosyltransferase [Mesonia ostreae]MDT0294118.1 glycosyltransferase [Mesonia ostreae]